MKDKTLKEKILIIIFIALALSLLIVAIINYKSIISLLGKMVAIAVPFIYGGCTAYLLTPLCNKIESKLKCKNVKHKEGLAITITETIFIILIIVICITIIPQSIKSITNIIETMPTTWKTFQETVQNVSGKHSFFSDLIGGDIKEVNSFIDNFVETTITPNIHNIITIVATRLASVGKTIINMIIGVIISIFVLANRKIFAKHSKIVLKAFISDKYYNIVLNEVEVANKMFSGFFIGKIIDSLIIGIICFIGLEILRMPYAVLVSVIVGITNVIPIVGPFIGAIPGAIIIFSADPLKSLYFIIFIIILQQIDGHIIGPKCIGSATGLSTFWVLFAIIFFGGLWGITGMLVGVPLLAVIFDIGKKIIKYRLDSKGKNLIET